MDFQYRFTLWLTSLQNRKHDQKILRWWKLEDERRQEKPGGAYPDHERSQGGPQCRYVASSDTITPLEWGSVFLATYLHIFSYFKPISAYSCHS